MQGLVFDRRNGRVDVAAALGRGRRAVGVLETVAVWLPIVQQAGRQGTILYS